MNWFACKVCAEKDKRITSLEEQIQTLKSQLGHSREREQKAVDQLLARQGEPSITPLPKLSAVDSQKAMEDIMAIFKDEDDTGDGTIVEADQLDHAKHGA
jgi:hypothetical protein